MRSINGLLSGTQAGIDISAAAFSNFKLSVPNGADSKGHILVAAGDDISLTVKAVDVYGNLISNYTGTVAVSSTDSLAVLPASYTFSASDAGSHVFHVQLGTATSAGVVWSLSAVDLANAATLATMTNFEVVNGVATSFVVATPANIEAGVGFIAKVTARDAFGNVVKNYFGTTHLSTTSAVSSLPSDYTYSIADLGVHDFFVMLGTSGAQTLTVNDVASGSVTGSDTETVNASVATRFAISASPSTVAGNAMSVTVQALDAFGNVSTGYRGSVVLQSSDSQASLPAVYTFANNDKGVHTFSVTLKSAGLNRYRWSTLPTDLSSVRVQLALRPHRQPDRSSLAAILQRRLERLKRLQCRSKISMAT